MLEERRLMDIVKCSYGLSSRFISAFLLADVPSHQPDMMLSESELFPPETVFYECKNTLLPIYVITDS